LAGRTTALAWLTVRLLAALVAVGAVIAFFVQPDAPEEPPARCPNAADMAGGVKASFRLGIDPHALSFRALGDGIVERTEYMPMFDRTWRVRFLGGLVRLGARSDDGRWSEMRYASDPAAVFPLAVGAEHVLQAERRDSHKPDEITRHRLRWEVTGAGTHQIGPCTYDVLIVEERNTVTGPDGDARTIESTFAYSPELGIVLDGMQTSRTYYRIEPIARE